MSTNYTKIVIPSESIENVPSRKNIKGLMMIMAEKGKGHQHVIDIQAGQFQLGLSDTVSNKSPFAAGYFVRIAA
jgi:hypothetical protein